MPHVGGKDYPYTKAGKRAAAQAKRKLQAQRKKPGLVRREEEYDEMMKARREGRAHHSMDSQYSRTTRSALLRQQRIAAGLPAVDDKEDEDE